MSGIEKSLKGKELKEFIDRFPSATCFEFIRAEDGGYYPRRICGRWDEEKDIGESMRAEK